MQHKHSCFLLCVLVLTAGVVSDAHAVDNFWLFQPLQASVKVAPLAVNEPFAVPDNHTQTIVMDETRFDVYPGVNDWLDMMVVNEDGIHTGRYLYRTHEVRPRVFKGIQYFKQAGGGGISVIDLKSGAGKILIQRPDWEAVDGLVWTGWNTLLFNEEVIDAEIPDPDVPYAKSGLVYEVFLNQADPTQAEKVIARPLLGSLAHEGIEVDIKGNVYVIDEHKKGSIYKFVPQRYGDLSEGQLYALKVEDKKSGNGTGKANWIALDMRQAQVSARDAARAVNANEYHRPEDLERIGDTLYVAITGEARVLSISLGDSPIVKEFVKAGVNVPKERFGKTGFESPDNLANGPGNTLWIVEDNEPSDIWVASPDTDGDGYADKVLLFGSLSTQGAEATGIYFSPDQKTLFVNIQHADDGNDKTIAISPSAKP